MANGQVTALGRMTFSTTLLPALFGLGTGLALIVAIGAQNAFVLRLGILGERRTILAVVSVCAGSDVVLILAGVLGIGAVVDAAPGALVVVRVLGAGFLVVYGLLAARRAFHPGALSPTDAPPSTSLRSTVGTAVALTWLNPHVYLDTVVFLGSVANQNPGAQRWWWAVGAVVGSIVWFLALGLGARYLRPFFARPRSWRILDSVIAVVMIGLGVRLALGD